MNKFFVALTWILIILCLGILSKGCLDSMDELDKWCEKTCYPKQPAWDSGFNCVCYEERK